MGSFIFFLLILFTGKSTRSCEIKFHPPKVFVEYGGSASASCSISQCNNVVGMGWESSFGGTGLNEGKTTLNTTFDNVSDWDVEPKCFVLFPDDTHTIQRLPFTVYKMPDRVSMPKPQTPMMATDSYDLQCDVEAVAPANILIVSWYKGNMMILEQQSTQEGRSPVNENFKTTVKVVPEDNGKEVWCEARLKFVPAEQSPPPKRSESHVLTVFYPPTFPKPQNESLEENAGTEISLNGTAAGNPKPIYSWYFIGSTQQGIRKEDETGPILTLEFRNPGVYACTATNAAGTSTKYFKVDTATGNWTFYVVMRITVVCLFFLVLVGILVFVPGNKAFCFTRVKPPLPEPISMADL